MRLVDADALIAELNDSHFPGAPYVDAGISIAVGKVCDAPTINPDIIRCGECKHYVDGYIHCNRVTWYNSENDFCSRAERRTDGV